MTQRLSVALLLLGAVLAAISCGPTGEPVLDMTLIPRALVNDGSKAIIKFVATDAKGQIGKGTIRVKSSIGSLSDGLDLTIDQFGTAQAEFSCDYAADPSCVGPTTVTATWVSDKQTATNEARVDLGPKVVSDGGTGGGGGGQTLNLDAIQCPTTNKRVWVFTGPTGGTPLIDYPITDQRVSANFIELKGEVTINNVPKMVLVSTGAPNSDALVPNVQVMTGPVGNPNYHRLQVASIDADCENQSGNSFRYDRLVLDAQGIVSLTLKFACSPTNSNSLARGCIVYDR
jgi:hypothetical protein